MPVPILTTTTLSWPAATPDRHSPRARTLTSLSTQTGAPVAVGEPLADRIAVPAGHDRRRDRAAGLELDRARARRSRSPTAGPGRPWVVASSWSNSASTRSRQRSGPASISAGSSWWPRIRPSRVGDARRRCSWPRGRRRGRGRRRPGRSAGAAAGRRCSARPRPRRRGRARSARRRAGRRSPGRARSASTSSERERDRPSRISSRTVTSASRASSGSGAGRPGVAIDRPIDHARPASCDRDRLLHLTCQSRIGDDRSDRAGRTWR